MLVDDAQSSVMQFFATCVMVALAHLEAGGPRSWRPSKLAVLEAGGP